VLYTTVRNVRYQSVSAATSATRDKQSRIQSRINLKLQRNGDAVRTADKTEVRRRYPRRPCAVSVTLLWARNLMYDVESDGVGVAEAYLTNGCVCCCF